MSMMGLHRWGFIATLFFLPKCALVLGEEVAHWIKAETGLKMDWDWTGRNWTGLCMHEMVM